MSTNILADLIMGREAGAYDRSQAEPTAFESRLNLFGNFPRERKIVNPDSPDTYKPIDYTTWPDSVLRQSIKSLAQMRQRNIDQFGYGLDTRLTFDNQINHLSELLNARTNKNRTVPPER